MCPVLDSFVCAADGSSTPHARMLNIVRMACMSNMQHAEEHIANLAGVKVVKFLYSREDKVPQLFNVIRAAFKGTILSFEDKHDCLMTDHDWLVRKCTGTHRRMITAVTNFSLVVDEVESRLYKFSIF